MMDCAHYRRAILADPHDHNADMRLHRDTCQDCSRYTDQVRRFEDRLDRALRLESSAEVRDRPGVLPFRIRDAQTLRLRRGWLAAAASLLLAVVVAGSLWLAVPGPSLAADVVTHMAGEPRAWARTDVSVPERTLDQVLAESQVRLRANPGLVSYANSCLFRGHHVPHLVVQTDSGPVTVMVLTHESARTATRFDDHGYLGMIVPVPGHGSIAVLERGPGTDMNAVERVAAKVIGAIDWSA
jgi:Protein of unknown function (DUF3379)